jgi:hypothetical protein
LKACDEAKWTALWARVNNDLARKLQIPSFLDEILNNVNRIAGSAQFVPYTMSACQVQIIFLINIKINHTVL